jgi:tripartite-type tricarboxylate transporter receptor subunit TctC
MNSQRVRRVIAASMLVAACSGSPTPSTTTAPPAGSGSPSPTSAPDATASPFNAEQYFQGQTITFVSTSAPGGGVDLIGRLVASHIGSFIPGQPHVAATNLERIGAMNYVFNGPPDGFNVLNVGGLDSSLSRQLLPESEYDVRETQLIGVFAPEPGTFIIDGALPFANLQDAIGNSDVTLRYAASVGAAEELQGPRLVFSWLCSRLELSCEMIKVGEDDSVTLGLMLERGEINIFDSPLITAVRLNSAEFESGTRRFFALFDSNPDVEASIPSTIVLPPSIESVLDETQTQEWKTLLEPAVSSILGKHYWVGPNVPEEIVAIEREAFNTMLADEDIAESFATANGSELFQMPTDEATTRMLDAANAFLGNIDAYSVLQQELWDEYWAD